MQIWRAKVAGEGILRLLRSCLCAALTTPNINPFKAQANCISRLPYLAHLHCTSRADNAACSRTTAVGIIAVCTLRTVHRDAAATLARALVSVCLTAVLPSESCSGCRL